MAVATGVRDEVNVCNLCGALENLSLCGGCRDAWYCSKAHQREDWRDHKQTCNKSKAEKSGSSHLDSEHNHRHKTSKHTDSSTTVLNDSEIHPSGLLQTIPSKESELQAASCEVTVSEKNTSKSHRSILKQNTNTSTEDSCASGSKLNATQTHSKSKTKEKSKHEKGHLPTISENGPTPERYYLNQSTHHINLPSSLKKQWMRQNSHSVTMGLEEKHLSVKETKEQYLSILWARFQELACYVLECLTKYGICAIDKFLGEATGQEILKEVLQLRAAGIMRQGQLVHGPSSSSNKYIRGDMITWVDESEPRAENIQYLISCMDAVVVQCAKKLEEYTINERTKAMVACYPGHRTKYVRHVDNPNKDGRCITCIYYLNKNWDVKQHGGLLRIYPEGSDQVANIEPKFDRLLFFWSDRRNPHEVEPAFVERFAITVWYYDAKERAEALKRYKAESVAKLKKQAVPLSSKPDSR
ncbi:hypothetical protein EGW08_020384 [Elysia chlorotica]|uniref:hypoxia-inducible factor-proline dioxygenase n=1 Tax=Elysia chlorotica TaxID=188477 RepID=A0A433SRG8_ELYCH|nr:hypothetical protein EGW08_020384 [Elysia chlorotica]